MPWLFSLLVFLPLIGGGPRGLALGAGPLPIVGNLVLHAVGGAVGGAVGALTGSFLGLSESRPGA